MYTHERNHTFKHTWNIHKIWLHTQPQKKHKEIPKTQYSLFNQIFIEQHTHTHAHIHRGYILMGKTNNKQIYNKISSSGKSFEENKLE